MLSICRNVIKPAKHTVYVARALSTTQHIYTGSNNGTINNITIMGGGIMGAGIAQAAAQSGFNVRVVDDDEFSQKCMVSILKSLNIISKKKFPDEPKTARKFIDSVISNITTTQSVEAACTDSDLVIEAVIENLPIKQDLFRKAEEIAPKHAIFASNTSSLSIQEIAQSTKRPDKFAGLHFFNPVWKMRAVEVIITNETSKETYDKLLKFCNDLGKVTVTSPDQIGFIVNRLLFPYLMEALRFLERGHSTIQDIDEAMKLGAGYPKGPFEIMDIIGLDTVKLVIDGWHNKEPENPLFFPSEILNNMVAKYKLGQKTGIGFYKYRHTLY